MTDEDLPGQGFFAVALDDVDRAIEHVTSRGYPPLRVDRRDDGTAELVFAILPDEQMYAFTQALPVHLSASIGIVGSDDEAEQSPA